MFGSHALALKGSFGGGGSAVEGHSRMQRSVGQYWHCTVAAALSGYE